MMPAMTSPAPEDLPARTREPQYQRELEMARRQGFCRFGVKSSQRWREDPRGLLFVLARYKFVAKLLAGQTRVVEVGCGDAFGTRLVQQEGPQVTVTDFDPLFIADVQARQATDGWPCDTLVHDILSGPVPPADYDAAYALDVFEHIPPEQEDRFVAHLAGSVRPDGVVIIGTPSRESQVYASPGSRAGHVNCKSGADLRAVMRRHFRTVFLFSMNDEVVHTGFAPMAHYLFAVCVTPMVPGLPPAGS